MSQRNSIWGKVTSKLERIGCKARAVSVEHLGELENEIERVHSQGLLADEVYRRYSYAFDFKIPEALPQARSIIVVAKQVPALQVTFTRNGRPFQVIVPPTYDHHTDQQVHDCIAGVLNSEGYRLVNAPLPKKLVATRSGLAKYGKNNITYVDGMGSYHRLTVYCTDAPLSEDHWQEPQMLDRCHTCTACLKKCPSGAVSSDRFLLRAEKCITYHNESERPFPDWIDPSWHNCLVGCMICQHVCPEIPPSVRRTVQVVTFSAEETELILQNSTKENFHKKTLDKLDRIGLVEYLELLSRNLKALLAVQE